MVASGEGPTHVSGLSTEMREGLVTTVLDAVPDVRYAYPCAGDLAVRRGAGGDFWLIWSIFSVSGSRGE